MESEHNLMISYDVSIGKDSLMAAIEEYGATILYNYNNFNFVAIRIPDGKFIGEAIEFFKNVDGVLSVLRDSKVHIDG